MEDLPKLTGQDFFNLFLDDAQVGTRVLLGYFPNRSNNRQGRPLLNGWIRCLGRPIFASFHFNLTGVGLSLRHAQQVEAAVGEEGAALATFTDFTRFSRDEAFKYVEQYLGPPSGGIRGHIVVGRPWFAAQLVLKVLSGKTWEEALHIMEVLHTEQNLPTSLQWGLYEMKELWDLYKTKGPLQRNLHKLRMTELQNLVLGYYLVGKGVFTDKADVDMIEVGVCHLDQPEQPVRCPIVTLVEPLAAMAVRNFLAKEEGWDLEDMGLNLEAMGLRASV